MTILYKTTGVETYTGNNTFQDWQNNTSHYDDSFNFKRRETQGVSIARYHQKVKDGVLLEHTPFIQKEVSGLSFTPWSLRIWRTDDSSQYWETYGDFRSHVVPSLYHAPDMSPATALVQQAAANIYQAGFDALTASSEFGSVWRLYKKIPKRLPDIIRRLRKLKPKQIANAWLEGRYGLRPLWYDIRDLNEAITNFDSNRRIWNERQGLSYSQQDVVGSTWQSGLFGTTQNETIYKTEHSLRGSVTAMVEPARFQVDPLQTGWERVPFSFILDWVFSVGNALAAVSLQQVAADTTSSYGYKSVTFCEHRNVVDNTPKSGNQSTFTTGSLYWTFTQSERIPSDIPSMPRLTGRAIRPEQLLDLTMLARARSLF